MAKLIWRAAMVTIAAVAVVAFVAHNLAQAT